MKPKFQSKQEIIINSSLEKVWEFNQDLSKIPEFHPRVNKVDLISGKQFREVGVSYQCNLTDGKNTCVEKDIEIIPMEKIVTEMVDDTLGLTKLLPDYIVETILSKVDSQSTKIEMLHYYSDKKLMVIFLNSMIKRKIAKQTVETLNGMKKWIEDNVNK